MDICDFLMGQRKRVLFAGTSGADDIRLLYGGLHRLEADEGARRVKDHWTLHIVLHGRAWCGVGAAAQRLRPGDAYLYMPFEDKPLVADARRPATWLWIGFDGHGLRRTFADHGIDSGGILPAHAATPNLRTDCERILTELDDQRPRAAEECQARLVLLINAILRAHGGSAVPAPPRRHAAVQAALAMIANSQGCSLGVAELAAGVHLDRSYFSRLFRAETGRTVQAVLNETRLRRACELLRAGDLSMARIADLTGFEEYNSFYRFFRRATGTTPSAYRDG